MALNTTIMGNKAASTHPQLHQTASSGTDAGENSPTANLGDRHKVPLSLFHLQVLKDQEHGLHMPVTSIEDSSGLEYSMSTVAHLPVGLGRPDAMTYPISGTVLGCVLSDFIVRIESQLTEPSESELELSFRRVAERDWTSTARAKTMERLSTNGCRLHLSEVDVTIQFNPPIMDEDVEALRAVFSTGYVQSLQPRQKKRHPKICTSSAL